MALSEQEWDVLNLVEQFYFLDGSVPTAQKVSEQLGRPLATVERLLSSKVMVEGLAARGIRIDKAPDLFSADQLAALALFFDTKDGRSLKKKFNDIGVTTQQWEAWKKEPTFSAYMRRRAEDALSANLAETEVALMDSAHRGDISAIKLHLEMAGRWSSKTVGELNVEFLLMKILEAVQKHVSNPDTIEAIANELIALSPTTNTFQSNDYLNGADTRSLPLAL